MTAGGVARHRATAWAKHDPFGVEFAEIDIAEDHLHARGVAIGTAPVPYRLDYELETATAFVTANLHVTSRGEGWRRELDLSRDAGGAWTVTADEGGHVDLPPAGGDATSLVGALDCDLGLSPVTNMMPILRHGLLAGGGPIELTVAWVAVPALSVQADGQRYRHLRSVARATVAKINPGHAEFARRLVNAMGSDELAQALSTMTKLSETLDALDGVRPVRRHGQS